MILQSYFIPNTGDNDMIDLDILDFEIGDEQKFKYLSGSVKTGSYQD